MSDENIDIEAYFVEQSMKPKEMNCRWEQNCWRCNKLLKKGARFWWVPQMHGAYCLECGPTVIEALE